MQCKVPLFPFSDHLSEDIVFVLIVDELPGVASDQVLEHVLTAHVGQLGPERQESSN